MALLVALLIGMVMSVPVVHYSVTARFRMYTEVVYQVGTSPPQEQRLLQWARTNPGVEHVTCERHQGDLRIRWEYRGSEPKSVSNTPEHLRALGYSISGMRSSWGVVARDIAGETAGVLTDPVALTAILSGSQLSLGLLGWRQIRVATRKGRQLPPLFSRNYGRAIFVGLMTGPALFGMGWLYTSGLRHLLGAATPGLWDAVGTLPASTRVALLLFGVVAAPVAEELFFRGFVFGTFKAAHRVGYGISISALLFAMAHFSDPYNMPAVFLFGVVLAWSFHRTGSLLTSVLAHALSNGLSIGAMLIR